jgi:transposase
LLKDRLGPISIVNPALPKAYGRSLGIREKSDWREACTLALFGRERRPNPTTGPLKQYRQLRELSRLYSTIQSDMQAYELRLSDSPETAAVKRELRATIRGLQARLKRLAEEMDAIIDRDQQLRQDVQHAETIVGVGRKTMYVVLAELGDLRTFKRNQLVAYAGLYPSEYTSGTTVHRKPHLAKGGGSRVRSALFMCALSAIRWNPHMRVFAERLASNGKTPMAVMGAIMRKLLLLIRTMVVNAKDYDRTHGFGVSSRAGEPQANTL